MLSTGENFYDVQYSLLFPYQIDNQCLKNPTYQDYVDNNYETIGCGSTLSTVLFMYSFVILVILIFLNLFIAIIMQGYSDIQESSSKVFSND